MGPQPALCIPDTHEGTCKKDFSRISRTDVNIRTRFFQISAHEGHSKAIEHKARCEAEASGHRPATAEIRKHQEKEDAKMERTIAKFEKKRALTMAYAAALENSPQVNARGLKW